MNKKGWLATGIILIGATTISATGNAGTEVDPLVTKSYVDSETAKQEAYILELREQINQLSQESGSVYEAVVVPAGKTIYGAASTEIIVRAGIGAVVTNGINGIQDVTSGVDIMNGTAVPNNHLLIVPREDGRGIQAIKQLTVMVRGEYIIN